VRGEIQDKTGRKRRLQGTGGIHISPISYGQLWWKDIISRKYNEHPE